LPCRNRGRLQQVAQVAREAGEPFEAGLLGVERQLGHGLRAQLRIHRQTHPLLGLHVVRLEAKHHLLEAQLLMPFVHQPSRMAVADRHIPQIVAAGNMQLVLGGAAQHRIDEPGIPLGEAFARGLDQRVHHRVGRGIHPPELVEPRDQQHAQPLLRATLH
jgi:hypothetical protein